MTPKFTKPPRSKNPHRSIGARRSLRLLRRRRRWPLGQGVPTVGGAGQRTHQGDPRAQELSQETTA